MKPRRHPFDPSRRRRDAAARPAARPPVQNASASPSIKPPTAKTGVAARPSNAANPNGKPAGAKPRGPRAHWQHVAEWYDGLAGETGSEYQQKIIFPGVLRLLGDVADKAILDVACGQGALCRVLAEKRARVTGVDAAEKLLDLARGRATPANSPTYLQADARELGNALPPASFDAATIILAIQNMTPLSPVWQGISAALKPGGRLVIVMMHPCFRVPRHSGWGWDAEAKLQYRRMDTYLTSEKTEIAVHPGSDPDLSTLTFHRPLQAYVNTLASAGMLIDHMDEWESHKQSQAGPKKAALDASRREIPLFLAIRAVKPGAPQAM